MSATPERKNPFERALKRERKARKRAEELLETRSRELYHSNQRLEKAYAATVEVFASLVGGRRGRSSENLRRIGREARNLSLRLGLSAEQAEVVYLSAVLCDLGKLALPDHVLDRPYVKLDAQGRKLFQRHPTVAWEALLALPPLEAVANTILDHCEYANGSGYPNGKQSDSVSIESRILCVIKDFDALVQGLILESELTESEAVEYLKDHCDTRYDRDIVTAFVDMLLEVSRHHEKLAEMRLTPTSAREGMVLTRDLVNSNDVLMLPAGRTLDEETIEKLRTLVKSAGVEILLYVAPETMPEDKENTPEDSDSSSV